MTIGTAQSAACLLTGNRCTPSTPVQVMVAVQAGQVACLVALLEAGASTAAATSSSRGLTACHIAAMVGSEVCLGMLLSFGCGTEAADQHGRTALYLAADAGHLGSAQMLLNAGASQARNQWGEQPLHAAAARGHTDCIRLLVERGASLDAQMEGGLSPLDLAKQHQQWEAERALVELGARHTGRRCLEFMSARPWARRCRRVGCYQHPRGPANQAAPILLHPSIPPCSAAHGPRQSRGPPAAAAAPGQAAARGSRAAALGTASDGASCAC